MDLSIIALGLSLLGNVIAVLAFIFSRKDKSNGDVREESYKWGSFDTKLDNIEKTLTKIENKLDSYDKEVDIKIDNAFKHHINEYHRG